MKQRITMNIAPKAEGTISVEQRERLLGIGAWVRIIAEVIYGARHGPNSLKIFGD
jgi:alpha-L-fucosidase